MNIVKIKLFIGNWGLWLLNENQSNHVLLNFLFLSMDSCDLPHAGCCEINKYREWQTVLDEQSWAPGANLRQTFGSPLWAHQSRLIKFITMENFSVAKDLENTWLFFFPDLRITFCKIWELVQNEQRILWLDNRDSKGIRNNRNKTGWWARSESTVLPSENLP